MPESGIYFTRVDEDGFIKLPHAAIVAGQDRLARSAVDNVLVLNDADGVELEIGHGGYTRLPEDCLTMLEVREGDFLCCFKICNEWAVEKASVCTNCGRPQISSFSYYKLGRESLCPLCCDKLDTFLDDLENGKLK